MAINKYNDPILAAIIKVLDEHGPAELRGRYGTGDPAIVSKSQVAKPMAFITYSGHRVGEPTNSGLRITGTLSINLVVDMTQDFGQGKDAKSHMTLVGLMIGMYEGDDGMIKLRADSIVGALRSHQHLGNNLRLSLGEDDEIDYDAMTRGKGIVTSEAVLTTIATIEVLNPRFTDQM